jgi:hypothetical protein
MSHKNTKQIQQERQIHPMAVQPKSGPWSPPLKFLNHTELDTR